MYLTMLLILYTSPVCILPSDAVEVIAATLNGCVCCPFSALTLLVGRQEGYSACKKLGAGVVIRLERGADLRMAELMPLPLTVCCFRKIQIGFTFLVPAHLGSPGKKAIKRVCVRACVRACYTQIMNSSQLVCCTRCCSFSSQRASYDLDTTSRGNSVRMMPSLAVRMSSIR